MPPSHHPDHFVVDGSNIATEGRSVPSLAQLNEAVLAFAAEHPDTLLTVVVDATFGHRIDKSEVGEFDEAVANNELVAPPAGAIGRGDAFVLTIADKAGAGVLSNDSFQEFHGQYDWLFDEGRLVGGKPVPYVGWVFVDRTPVRGPKSRQAVKAAKSGRGRTAKSSAKRVAASPEDAVAAKEKAKAMIRPKSNAGEQGSDGAATSTNAATDSATAKETGSKETRSRKRGGRTRGASSQSDTTVTDSPARDGFVNDLMPFLDFVADHPVDTTCEGVIETYASHGAYARAGDVAIYLPLRLMGDPPPRSARSVVKVGTPVTMKIVGFVPDRRSIDAALVSAAVDPGEFDGDELSTIDETSDAPSAEPADTGGGRNASRKRSAPKKAAKAAAKKPAAKRSAKKAAGKRSGKQATNESAADDATASVGKPAGTADEPMSKPAKKAAAKKAAKAPAKKAAAKKAGAKKASAKNNAADKTVAKKAAAKKASAKSGAGTKAAAKKRAAGRRAADSANSDSQEG